MRRCLLFLCLAAIPFLSFVAPAQREAAGKLEISKYPLVLDSPPPPRPNQIDPVKLRAEATELNELARSVSSEVDQVAQGMLPKDFADKLKRIEKLSKHLRGEVTH